ncbi:MAG: helix-turn-helix domain-containing protein [Sporichthyaceae bacterium]
MQDEARARRFAADELGELAADDDRVERIRATLLDWLSTGSTSQTALRLHVHENTVRTRIVQAEALLHRDLGSRRAELMAALRLRAMLGEQAQPGRPA